MVREELPLLSENPDKDRDKKTAVKNMEETQAEAILIKKREQMAKNLREERERNKNEKK